MSERERIEAAVSALERHRDLLGEHAATALDLLREKLAALTGEAARREFQRKQVTVLFADVSGFTRMAELMDAEDVGDTMNALWRRLDTAITARGGAIDKHIGDAVMAIFGAPVSHENDPHHAVRAALDMQEELRLFIEETAERNLPPLRMRIGINSGPVLLGPVGTTAEYTAMGDAVNLASRLEHAAPIGGVLISAVTHRLTRGSFEVAARDPITVKGEEEAGSDLPRPERETPRLERY